MLTPAQKSARGRAAVNARWARVRDREAATRKMREAADQRFWDQAREMHPDHADDDVFIEKIANNLRAAHIAKMTLASLKSRQAKNEPPAAETEGSSPAS